MSPEAIIGALGVLGFIGMLVLSFRLGRLVEHRDQRARLLAMDAEVAELITKFTSHVKRDAGAVGRAKTAENREAAQQRLPLGGDIEVGRAQARQMFRQRDAAGGNGG